MAAPDLRRDPTAQQKLEILAEWQKAFEKEGVDTIRELRTATKKGLEAAHHWLRASVVM